MDRRIISFIIVCMLGLTPAYAANICDPRDGTACEGANTSATGGGAHTSEYSLGSNNYGQGVFTGQKAVYATSNGALITLVATTDPFFLICGSNTRTVYIQKFNIQGSESTTAVRRNVVMRYTLNRTRVASSTGPTPMTAVPFDSAYGLSTVDALFQFTTASTVFTNTGASNWEFASIIGSQTLIFGLTGTPGAGHNIYEAEWDFIASGNDRGGPVLHGSSQCIEVFFSSIGANAPVAEFTMQWAEIEEK